MDDDQLIPNNNIVDENNDVPDDVEMLRPNSRRPFSVKRNKITLKFWLMPERRIASIKLINPVGVQSIAVWFIRPSLRASKERAVVKVSLFCLRSYTFNLYYKIYTP
jgi:hypothetical protein